MVEHIFGGDWTDKKLECLQAYLAEYRKIFERNERARHFRTWYVDAFAGTGSRVNKKHSPAISPLFEDVYKDKVSERYKEGSAIRALALKSPFDRYLFVEKSRTRVGELERSIRAGYPMLASRCEFDPRDANESLQHWCAHRDWRHERAVVFLDPYGMQVRWKTIEMLGATNAVDLWYLFPLGSGVLRLLRRDGEIEES